MTGSPTPTEAALWAVQTKDVKEIKDKNDKGTGVYEVPVIIKVGRAGSSATIYSVEAVYVGGGVETGDGATGEAYKISAKTTFRPAVREIGVLKFAPVTLYQNTLSVPEWPQGQPEPAPAVKTVTFRVKLIGQARAFDTGSRMLTGRADTPEELAKWIAPTAFDTAGRTIKAEFGRIREEKAEQYGKKSGQYKSTGIYQVEVKLIVPTSLAGKKAAISFGRNEGGVIAAMGGTVNFVSSGPETEAAQNPYFDNPYLVNAPHTPEVYSIDFVGVKANGTIEEFATYGESYPTTGDYIIGGNDVGGFSRTNVTSIRLRASVEDLDGYNIMAAEFFKQPTLPSPAQDGTGTPMLATMATPFSDDPTRIEEDPGPPPFYLTTIADVYYDIPAADVKAYGQGQWDFWPHGKNANNEWGSLAQHYNTGLVADRTLSVDLTKPASPITDPVNGQFVGRVYHILGDGDMGNDPNFESPLNSIQVDESGDGNFADLAESDSSRGGYTYNLSKWFYNWDSAMTGADGQFYLRVRALDLAGNYGDESVIAIKVDNSKPTASITYPSEGMAWDNTINSSIDLTGTVYDQDAPAEGTKIKTGAVAVNATDRANIGGSWSGNNLTADRLIGANVTCLGTLVAPANTIVGFGSTIKAGTVAANATDRTALGGAWTTTSPYTLTADTTLVNTYSQYASVTYAAGTVLKLNPVILGSDSFDTYSFEWNTGRRGQGDPGWLTDRWTYAAGHTGGANPVAPAGALGTWDVSSLCRGRLYDPDKRYG